MSLALLSMSTDAEDVRDEMLRCMASAAFPLSLSAGAGRSECMMALCRCVGADNQPNAKPRRQLVDQA